MISAATFSIAPAALQAKNGLAPSRQKGCNRDGFGLFPHRECSIFVLMSHAPKPRPISPSSPEEIPDRAQKGRGAVSNRPGRYEPGDRPFEADGWDWQEEDDAPKLKTTVTVDKTKSIIARNKSPDVAFEQSINAYRGCENGCFY